MKSIAKLSKGITIIALTTLIGHAPALAGTFVYVSNADEGDIQCGGQDCRRRLAVEKRGDRSRFERRSILPCIHG